MLSLSSFFGLLLALVSFQYTSLCDAYPGLPISPYASACASNGQSCPMSQCCSQGGYCGNTTEFCNVNYVSFNAPFSETLHVLEMSQKLFLA